MRIPRIATSAAFAAGLAALPLSAAQAQYYAPCSPFPLAWPFCIAGAALATAATIAATPFWLLAGAPPYGYYPPPYYAAQSYYAPSYYAPPATYYATPPAAPHPAPPSPTQPPASHGQSSGQDAYYFCPASNGYYPYVASCAAWRSVPVIPPQLTAGSRVHVARQDSHRPSE